MMNTEIPSFEATSSGTERDVQPLVSSLHQEWSRNLSQDLNEQQCAAVMSPPGLALVIAGAGTGKTRTLTYRVAWQIAHGLPASAILLLTFTNKAAREMLNRISKILPGQAYGIWGGTFHSIGHRILRKHSEHLGFAPGFSVLDREDQEQLVTTILSERGFSKQDKNFPKKRLLLELFSLSVNKGLPMLELLSHQYPYLTTFGSDIEQAQIDYELRKKAQNVFDFDDLLVKTLELFAQHPPVAEHYQEQFQSLLVDEFQDTNRLQAQFVDVLSQKCKNLMVVGDDAQAIYSWRGADCENILQFPKWYPGTQLYKIETNYRSVPEILTLANAVIASNERQFKKELHPVRKSQGQIPQCITVNNAQEQATFVAQQIAELASKGQNLNEVSVLYRAHYQCLELQLELTERGIPFNVTSGLRFFEQAHIKDVAAVMKFLVNPQDQLAFTRIVRLLPGIGAKSANKLFQEISGHIQSYQDIKKITKVKKVPAKALGGWEQIVKALQESVEGEATQIRPKKPAAVISVIIKTFYDAYLRSAYANYTLRLEDLKTVQEYAQRFEDLSEFLAQLTLLGNLEIQDTLKPGLPGNTADSSTLSQGSLSRQGMKKKVPSQHEGSELSVTLSSVHQAKGLEWEIVFLIGLAEGQFPSVHVDHSVGGEAEERRLFYVAVTRCKNELYLLYPQTRRDWSGGMEWQEKSRFLEELPHSVYAQHRLVVNRKATVLDNIGRRNKI